MVPFGGAIDEGDYIPKLGGLQSGSGNAGLCDERTDVGQCGEIEASSDAAEFADLRGEALLTFDPVSISGRSEGLDAVLAERRRRKSAEEFAKRVELQNARGSVEQIGGHQGYVTGAVEGGGSRKIPTRSISLRASSLVKPARSGALYRRLPHHREHREPQGRHDTPTFRNNLQNFSSRVRIPTSGKTGKKWGTHLKRDLACGASALRCGCGDRKFDDEESAAFILVATGDLAAVVLDDSVNRAESET